MTSRDFVLGGWIALTATAVAAPQSPTPAGDVQTVGPRIGATVPTFVLPDQTAQPRSLASLMGPKGAVLVFFRSADW